LREFLPSRRNRWLDLALVPIPRWSSLWRLPAPHVRSADGYGGPETALKSLRWIIEHIGLRLNEQKTHLRNTREEPFDFLGYTFGPMVSRRTEARYLGVTPSKKRVKRFRQSLRLVLRPGNQGRVEEVVAEVNRRLVGWANYFSVGTLGDVYRSLDEYSCMLLRDFLVRRHKVPERGSRRFGISGSGQISDCCNCTSVSMWRPRMP
jgi:hypothetical protein